MKVKLEKLGREALQRQVDSDDESGFTRPWNHLYYNKLSFSESAGLYDIHYFGAGEPDYCFLFRELLDLIASHPKSVRSLHFSGPDQGANGLKEWRFDRLAECEEPFENLIEFRVQLFELGDHNIPVLGAVDRDTINSEMLLLLLGKMPSLLSLAIPDVLPQGFESVLAKTLRWLRIQAVWDHRRFIHNLADIPFEFSLDYTDTIFLDNSDPAPAISETYGKSTDFKDYKKLLSTETLPSGWHLKLRESTLTKAQLFKLQNLNRQIQLLHIPTGKDRYVSHWMQDEGEW